MVGDGQESGTGRGGCPSNPHGSTAHGRGALKTALA